jgi:hypothetical protein
VALPLLALPAFAEEAVREIPPSTSRMGGKLDAYSDIGKGWSLYKQSTWNKFDGTPGEYDAKWQDVVGFTEQIVVRASAAGPGAAIELHISRARSLPRAQPRSPRLGGCSCP